MTVPQEWYASVADVRSINAFPAADDPDIEAFIALGAGELNTLLRLKGVSVPVQAPADLVLVLRKAVAYSAAASVEAKGVAGADPSQVAAGVQTYQAEFARIRDWLAALTDDDLTHLGLLSGGSISSHGLVMGLRVAHASNGAAPSWRNTYPFTFLRDGEES